MQLPLKHPIFKILSGIAAEKGIEAYVIGGYVRDLLFSVLPKISTLSFTAVVSS